MLYDVIDFHLPSLGAIAIEFSRLPSMFGLIKKFRRAAVLTDKNWIKNPVSLKACKFLILKLRLSIEIKKKKLKHGYLNRCKYILIAFPSIILYHYIVVHAHSVCYFFHFLVVWLTPLAIPPFCFKSQSVNSPLSPPPEVYLMHERPTLRVNLPVSVCC